MSEKDILLVPYESSPPTKSELLDLLGSLVHLNAFASQLLGISLADVGLLFPPDSCFDKKKEIVVSKYLITPEPSWQCVAVALIKSEESTLALNIIKNQDITASTDIKALMETAEKMSIRKTKRLLQEALKVQDDYSLFSETLHNLSEPLNPAHKPTVSEISEILELLVDWELLASHLPDITDAIVNEIKQKCESDKDQKIALALRWISISPSASWKQFIIALVKCVHILSSKLISSPIIKEELEYEGTKLDSREKNLEQFIPQVNAVDVTGHSDITTIKKILLQLLKRYFSFIRNSIRDCLEDVSAEMYSLELISGNVRNSPNSLAIMSEFESGFDFKNNAVDMIEHCNKFLKSLAYGSRGGPAFLAAQFLASDWNKYLSEELSIPLLPLQHTTEMVDLKFRQASKTREISLKSDDQVENEFCELINQFEKLIKHIKTLLDELISSGQLTEGDFLESVGRCINNPSLATVITYAEFFSERKLYYSFSNFELIQFLANKFLNEDASLLTKIKEYAQKLEAFDISAELRQVKRLLKKNSFISTSQMHNVAHQVVIKLHEAWSKSTMHNIKELLLYLFSGGAYLLHHLILADGSLIVNLVIHPSHSMMLKKNFEVWKKFSFMNQVGIFELSVNEETLYIEDYNANFSFERSLLEAVAVNTEYNEIFQFLLELADVNYQNSDDGKTPLIIASEHGHNEIVKALIFANCNINIQDMNGLTALMIACQKNHVRVVETLIQAGVDYSVVNANGSSAFYIACCFGNFHSAELLLKKRITVDDQNNFGVTGLAIACQNGHDKTVEFLLRNGANPNISTKNGFTALMLASREGKFEVVKLLLDSKANPNMKNESGDTALIIASFLGHFEIVDILLKANADPTFQSNSGMTALMVASYKGHLQIVELLKIYGNHNVQNTKQFTALMFASENGHYKVVEGLLSQADANIRNVNGVTALMLASEGCHLEVVKLLVTKANINLKMNDNRTALILASENGHDAIVKILLKAKANISAKDSKGSTSLMLASRKCHLKVAQTLLKEGADPNIKNNSGDTALSIASENGHIQIVDLLLENNIDIDSQNNEGLTALMLASQNGHFKIAQSLLNKKANVKLCSTNNGFTALMIACAQGHINIAKLILISGADPNLQDRNNGLTGMMFAILNGSYSIVELLSKHKADASVKKKDGVTALMLACTKNHYQIVRLLLANDAEPNLMTEKGETALTIAVQFRNSQIVQLLLDMNANADLQHLITGQTALMMAVQRCFPEIVHQLLAHGANVNISNVDGDSALDFAVLSIAAKSGNYPDIPTEIKQFFSVGSLDDSYKIFDLLLQQESLNVNRKDNNGFTCLMAACQFGLFDVVKALLQKNANCSIQNNDGWTAIMLACKNNYCNVVELLIEAGANLNVQINNGGTALTIAAEHGFYGVVELLLKAHVNSNICNKGGTSALMYASQNNHQKVVELLLQEHANGNLQAKGGITALMIACNKNHMGIVNVLLNGQVQVDIRSEGGRTALMICSENGYTELVDTLLQAHANPNIQDKDGLTALMLACKQGHYQVSETLIAMKASANIATEKGVTAMTFACDLNHYEIAKLLLKHVEINYQNFSGLTYLMLATLKNDHRMVQLFLDESSNPNIQAGNGETALMIAATNGHFQSAELLIQHHANLDIRNNDGWTALMWAVYSRHLLIVKLLLEHNADCNIQNNQGWVALMIASSIGHLDIAELLASKTIANVQTSKGMTALSLAASNGKKEVVELLLKAKAININLKHATSGQTAYTMAVQRGYSEIVKLLEDYGADIHTLTIDGNSSLHLVIMGLSVAGANSNDISMEMKKSFPGTLENYMTVFHMLLDQKVDLDIQNDDGLTSLMIACRNRVPLTIAESLLHKGANPNIQDKKGKTALDIAIKTSQPNLGQLLLSYDAKHSTVPQLETTRDPTDITFWNSSSYDNDELDLPDNMNMITSKLKSNLGMEPKLPAVFNHQFNSNVILSKN